MDTQSIFRGAVTGGCMLAALGLLPIAVDPAAGGGLPATPTVGDAVVAALVAASAAAAADNSADCTGQSMQAVAYRTDRVVLSTQMSGLAAGNIVRAALHEIGVPAEITGVEIISMNTIRGAGGVVPVVSVSFRPPPRVTVPVKLLARHLRLVKGVPASPDYLLSPSSGPSEFWPQGAPKPTVTPAPQRAVGIGAGRTIFLYDTGLLSEVDGNIPPNVTKLTSEDSETPDTLAPLGVVDLGSAGHGTAVAGVLNTMAPAAAVKAVRITEPEGVATDVSAARRMAETLLHAYNTGSWPDLIVNAFGSAACNVGQPPGAEMAPLGLKMVAEAVELHNQALVVASAGNRSSNRRFYPAAFPTVIGVGGLDARGSDGSAWTSPSRSGPRAAFSNWGPWVKAWLPAVSLTTTHVKGYKFEPTGLVIDGLAVVDGTSFAAPMAAALIAEQMAARGWGAKPAWNAIIASGVVCSTAIGSGVAIALTSLNSPATGPPLGGAPVEC
jgi:Subtilase family